MTLKRRVRFHSCCTEVGINAELQTPNTEVGLTNDRDAHEPLLQTAQTAERLYTVQSSQKDRKWKTVKEQ